MNIIVLDRKIQRIPKYYIDRHVCKMQTEAAQMLCTARRMYGDFSAPYQVCQPNHPCSKWARQSLSNYLWLCELGVEICNEYKYRFGKIHAVESVLYDCMDNPPGLPNIGLTEFIQCIPDEYKRSDPILGYRHYYSKEKRYDRNGVWMFRYTKRKIPEWALTNGAVMG